MYIKQISVFVENKPGRLVEITREIADAGIDLRAVSLADTSDFGILRIIVDNPDEAERILKESGHTVALTDVIAVGIYDSPGEFSKAMKILSDNKVNVDYMYAFTGNRTGTAYVIIKSDDLEKGAKLLQEGGIDILDANDVYNI